MYFDDCKLNLIHFTEYEEVIATLDRLQVQMKSVSGIFGMAESGIRAELEAVTRLLTQKRFADALSTFHTLKNKLHNTGTLQPKTDEASILSKDVSLNCLVFFQNICRISRAYEVNMFLVPGDFGRMANKLDRINELSTRIAERRERVDISVNKPPS